MNTSFVSTLSAHYNWLLSLYAGLAIMTVSFVLKFLAKALLPTFRQASVHNRAVFNEKMQKAYYAENHAWNRRWSVLFVAVIFGIMLPFSITDAAQPWWRILRDIFIILMFYDFFYYLTHRFIFHDSGVLGGPLLWVHSVHHRQHNPCRMDSSFIHPIEVAIGLGLYGVSTLVLAILMGPFHIVTIVITWIAFMEINLHNHDQWKVDTFPFKYLNYMSVMHHNHHKRFTGGNFATISLLYDWIFGTLDRGQGDPAQIKRAERASRK